MRFYIVFILIFLLNRGTMIVLHNFIISRRPKLGKSVGFACHIRLDVKLCSNNERNCVFRCVVSAAHFLILGGSKNEETLIVCSICFATIFA